MRHPTECLGAAEVAYRLNEILAARDFYRQRAEDASTEAAKAGSLVHEARARSYSTRAHALDWAFKIVQRHFAELEAEARMGDPFVGAI